MKNSFRKPAAGAQGATPAPTEPPASDLASQTIPASCAAEILLSADELQGVLNARQSLSDLNALSLTGTMVLDAFTDAGCIVGHLAKTLETMRLGLELTSKAEIAEFADSALKSACLAAQGIEHQLYNPACFFAPKDWPPELTPKV